MYWYLHTSLPKRAIVRRTSASIPFEPLSLSFVENSNLSWSFISPVWRRLPKEKIALGVQNINWLLATTHETWKEKNIQSSKVEGGNIIWSCNNNNSYNTNSCNSNTNSCNRNTNSCTSNTNSCNSNNNTKNSCNSSCDKASPITTNWK